MTKFWRALLYIPMPRGLSCRVHVRWLNSMPSDVRREMLARAIRAAFPAFALYEEYFEHSEPGA